MGDIKLGNLSISKLFIGSDEISAIYYGDTLVYESSSTPTPTLISFSVSANGTTTTYQAESGMTWEQWIASAYNTGNFGLDTLYSPPRVYDNDYWFVYDQNYTYQVSTDTITANYEYFASGGSND